MAGVKGRSGGKNFIPERHVCARCGGSKHRGPNQLCRDCWLARRYPRVLGRCAQCRREFQQLRGTPRRTCSAACAKARQREGAQARAERTKLPWADRIQTRRRSRRLANHRRRQRRGGHSVPAGRWRRLCDRDGYACWICREPIDPRLTFPNPMSGSTDHVVPLVLGGSDSDHNLRPAHFSCNSKRGASLLPLVLRGWMSGPGIHGA